MRVEKDLNFENYFPPYFKSLTYYHLAKLYAKEKDIVLASVYAQKSVDINHNLNKPFNDWLGINSNTNGGIKGELSDPWVLLGDVSLQDKNYQKARESYARALKVFPNKPGVADKLKMIETALSQAK